MSHRNLATHDLETISSFPQSVEELFYIGPRFVYPLTPEQIVNMLVNRASPTVVVNADNDQPIAYANLYDIDAEQSTCYLGNVILASAYRGKGVAEYLLNVMMTRAREEHRISRLKLYCHNTNTRALIFYTNHGFIPCGSKIIDNHEGRKIASIEMERAL
ncbi:GNAT family N-acetyltransferase [Cohnella yongneupensis]|uniref:GNAT family N-acetyltransferase n=1 Tax=Cohnella yongneupensis TaxID=425006 RepID=A0ABW0QV77_9BACL